jgi:hypothetical protein
MVVFDMGHVVRKKGTEVNKLVEHKPREEKIGICAAVTTCKIKGAMTFKYY